MEADDTVDNSKPYPDALKRFIRMKFVEGRQQLSRIFMVESNAVVPDIINNLTIPLNSSEFDAGVLSFCGELPGIAGRFDRTTSVSPQSTKALIPSLMSTSTLLPEEASRSSVIINSSTVLILNSVR